MKEFITSALAYLATQEGIIVMILPYLVAGFAWFVNLGISKIKSDKWRRRVNEAYQVGVIAFLKVEKLFRDKVVEPGTKEATYWDIVISELSAKYKRSMTEADAEGGFLALSDSLLKEKKN